MDLPTGIGKPAERVLVASGYTELERLTKVRRGDLAKLHGVGPKALGKLADALAANGLSFAGE